MTKKVYFAGSIRGGRADAELKDFFAWYNSIPARLRIFVAGNHCPRL